MKNNKLPIGLNKLNLVLFLTLTFPAFAADHDRKFSDEEALEADIPEILPERKLDYVVVANFVHYSLMKMIEQNALLPRDVLKRQEFSIRLLPKKSLADFIDKFSVFKFDPSTLLATLINIEKFLKKIPRAKITQYNAQRIFAVALMVTHKHESEHIYPNADFAIISKIDIKTLNEYERMFLNVFDFRLMINRDEYDEFVLELCKYQWVMAQAAANKLTKKR